MNRILRLFGLVVLGFFFKGCSIIDPAIPIPAYIHVDSVHLAITNSAQQGSASTKISDAWIYVNDQLVGAFQVPCTVPVLASGNCEVSVDAGIKISGLSANRGQYPFYSQYNKTNVNLTPGKVTTVQPIVNYMAQTQFTWMENFESVQPAFTSNIYDVSDTVIKVDHNPADVFEGKACGVVNLVAGATQVQYLGLSSPVTGFTLPYDGQTPVYLELNYKCNNSFTVGFYGGLTSVDLTTPIPVLNINPSSNWNKIYINFTQGLAQVPSQNYVIYFFMTPDNGVTHPTLYLDNIKLIHF